MGTVGTKKKNRVEGSDQDIDWEARTKQAHKVGRLGLIIRAMRPSDHGAKTGDGTPPGPSSAPSAWNNVFGHRNSRGVAPLPPERADLSEKEKAMLTREEELGRLTGNQAYFQDKDGKLNYDTEIEESEFMDPCVICATYKRDDVLECRVCGRPYHHGCLVGRGLGLDTNSAKAMEIADTEIGWSCPDCEALSEMIAMDAMNDLIMSFDNYDTDGDGIITMPNYMEFQVITYERENGDCIPGSKVKQCEETFRTYDGDRDGVVSWWDFLMVETINILKHEPRSQILQHLKPKEITRIRKFFKMSDKNNIGLVTVGESEQAYRGWLRAQGLHETEEMMRSFERSSLTDECKKMITWERFIWDKALALITARPNTLTIKPYVTTNEETAL